MTGYRVPILFQEKTISQPKKCGFLGRGINTYDLICRSRIPPKCRRIASTHFGLECSGFRTYHWSQRYAYRRTYRKNGTLLGKMGKPQEKWENGEENTANPGKYTRNVFGVTPRLSLKPHFPLFFMHFRYKMPRKMKSA